MSTESAQASALTVRSPRGLAIDEYVVVAVEQRVERASECLFASDFGDELDLGGRQVDVAGQKIEVLDTCVNEDVVGGDPRVDENVVDRHVEVVVGDTETGRQRTLGVEIDEEHAAAAFGERCAEVDGGGGLADPTFLVAHRDDLRGTVGRERGRFGYRPARPSRRSEFDIGDRRCGLRVPRSGGRERPCGCPGLCSFRGGWLRCAHVRYSPCLATRSLSHRSLSVTGAMVRRPFRYRNATASCPRLPHGHAPPRGVTHLARGCAPAHTSRSAPTVTSVYI